MLRLARMGVVILPANPGFYHHPQTVGELVDFVVARILDQLAWPIRSCPAGARASRKHYAGFRNGQPAMPSTSPTHRSQILTDASTIFPTSGFRSTGAVSGRRAALKLFEARYLDMAAAAC